MADATVRQRDSTQRFVKENPGKARILASDWQKFLQNHPEAATISSTKGWYEYVNDKNKFPEGGPDRNLWACKEVNEALSVSGPGPNTRISSPDEEGPSWAAGLEDNARLAALPALAFFGSAQAIDEDNKYHKIRSKLREEWLKKNPGKNFNSAEGIDFLYGSLDKPSNETLDAQAEEIFRKRYAKKAKKYDKKQAKHYDDVKKDPTIRKQEYQIRTHAYARYQLAKKNGSQQKLEDFQKAIEKKTWDDFVTKYHTDEKWQKKLDLYAQKHEGIRTAQEVVRERNDIRKIAEEKEHDQQTTNDQLRQYELATGKQIHAPEKIHPPSPTVTSREATERLAALAKAHPTPAENLNPLPHSRGVLLQTPPPIPSQSGLIYRAPLPTAPPRSSSPSFVPKKKLSRKGAEKIKKLGKEAKKAFKTAEELAKGARLLATLLNPYVAVPLGIFFFILIVVIAIGGGSSENAKADKCDTSTQNCSPDNTISGLTLSLSGPTQVKNQEAIQYTIAVSYTGNGVITVYDPLPADTTFVETGLNDVSIVNKTGEATTVSWSLTDNTKSCGKQSTTLTCSFSIKIIPLSNDNVVVNKVFATAPQNKLIGLKSSSLEHIFESAASTAQIPPAFLVAIAQRESGLISYTDDDITTFSTHGWWTAFSDDAPTLNQLPPLIRKGYAYNTCAFPKNDPICPGKDVRGAMQFEEQTWDGIKSTIHPTDGHDPDRRNVVDMIQGAAMLNKQHATDPRVGNTSASDWDENTVKALARWYCAGPRAVSHPELVKTIACGWHKEGDKTYDDAVWEYYTDFK